MGLKTHYQGIFVFGYFQDQILILFASHSRPSPLGSIGGPTQRKIQGILIKRFKDIKVPQLQSTIHHPPPTIHKIKQKSQGIKTDILVKYKRIKWTPSRKEFALSFQGKL